MMTGKTITATMCLLGMLLAGCGADQTGGYGLVRITERVYAFIPPDASSANGLGANSGFIVGDDAVMVVDSRYTGELAAELDAAIKTVTEIPVRYVVNTHYHPDHVWGNSFFRKKGATIISTLWTRIDIEKYSPVYLAYYRDQKPDAFEQLRGVEPVLPDSTFTGTLRIALGGIEAELIQLGPAHTAGDAAVLVPGERALFAGGILSNGYHANMGDQGADFDGWENALESIKGMKVKSIIPGQGAVCGKEALDLQRKYLDAVVDLSVSAIAAGKQLSETAEGASVPGFDGFLQANILPFNIQAVYKRKILDVVDPDFTIDLPGYCSAVDGNGNSSTGRVLWTGQSDDGYCEVEITWQPTNRRDIIAQDIEEQVARYMAARETYDMMMEGVKKIDVGGAEETAAFGRWNIVRDSRNLGGGIWTWAMIIRSGKLYSIQLSMNAGYDRAKETAGLEELEKGVSGFRMKR